MAIKGSDFLYIGLGAGALYLLYKSQKPVTDIEGSAASLVGGTVGAVQAPISSAGNLLNDVITGVDTNIVKPLFDVTKGVTSGDPWLAGMQTIGTTAKNALNIVTGGIPAAGEKIAGSISTGIGGLFSKTPTTQTIDYASRSVSTIPVASVAYTSPTGVQYGTYSTPQGGKSGIIPPLIAATASAGSPALGGSNTWISKDPSKSYYGKLVTTSPTGKIVLA